MEETAQSQGGPSEAEAEKAQKKKAKKARQRAARAQAAAQKAEVRQLIILCQVHEGPCGMIYCRCASDLQGSIV